MGGKSRAPAPDPRMGEAAVRQIALAEQQWQNYISNEQPWMQGIVNRAVGTYEDSTRRANNLNDYQLGMMRRNDDRYWGTAVPFEDELLGGVRRFDSDAFKEGQVGMARADVRQAFDGAEREAQRTAGRFGLNRVVRASTDVGLERAKAEANAANKTRQAAEQIGLSTKMQMYGGMRGLAGLGATNAQLGLASMGAAQAGAGGMGSTGFGMIGANNQSFNSAMGGMSAGIQGLGQFNQLQQNAAQINNANNPFATMLGAGTMLGAAWLGRR